MLTINTNLSSLIAQGSMKQSTNKLNQAIERMTTGFKINHAKDNAANYSIATNMTTKIGAYNVAEDNAAMGLDLISTAEGTLSQIEDKLQRLRALAEQASNGTYGEQSLNAINAEANALVDEINRLYSTAEYNSIKLFDQETQIPDDPNIPKAQYDGFIKEVVKRDTSTMTTLASVDGSADLADGTYSISTPEEMKKLADMTNAGLVSAGDEFVLANDIDLSQYENWTPIGNYTTRFCGIFDGNGCSILNLQINTSEASLDANSGTGLFGNIKNATIKNVNIEDAKIFAVVRKMTACLSGGSTSSTISNCVIKNAEIIASAGSFLLGDIHSTNISDCYINDGINRSKSSAGLVTFCGSGITNIDNCYINADIFGTSISAGLLGANQRTVNISNCYILSNKKTLDAVFIGKNTTDTASSTLTNCYYNSNLEETPLLASYSPYQTITVNNVTKIFSISLPSNYINLQVGINSCENSKILLDTVLNIDFLQYARNIGLYEFTINKLDICLNQVSEKQTHFGAISNRLESVLEEITIQRDNLVSSRSTIRDADIAEVSSQYIQQQILQQASATLLATANQSPSIALQLI